MAKVTVTWYSEAKRTTLFPNKEAADKFIHDNLVTGTAILFTDNKANLIPNVLLSKNYNAKDRIQEIIKEQEILIRSCKMKLKEYQKELVGYQKVIVEFNHL